MNELELTTVRRFQAPAPVKEVNNVAQKDFVKQILVDMLKKGILHIVPKNMLSTKRCIIVHR